ncbi:MAG: hypothetical protein GQ546_00875 [Gammaproteobacteria bacterium]|nr:hypothetical protein [Gammaproteobacteria bacterium]
MLKVDRKDLQFNKSIYIYFFIILFFCVLSKSLIAEPLPLITVGAEKNTTSLENLKIDDESKLLKYVKELQLQSQIIAKDYFYIAQGLREDKARIEIKESAREIDNILNILTVSIKNEEMQNLLIYLNEINLESKSVFNDSFSNENASLVIDFSETIYEGSQSIIEYLLQSTNNDKSLFNEISQQKFALQRINKFYIAYQAGFNDKTMLDRLAQSVKIFEKGLETLNLHKFLNYDQEFAFVRLKNSWAISKKFYEGMEKGDLTLIVSVSTDHLMSYLDKIISLENKF